MTISVLAEIYFGIVPEFEGAGDQLSSDLTFGEEQVRRYATRDFYDEWERFYQAGLLNAPSIAQHLDDLYFGIERTSPVQVQLSNADGAWDTLAQDKDLRTAWLVCKYHDEESGHSFQWRGRVVEYSVSTAQADLRAEMRDDESLEIELPRDVVDIDKFALTARDAGKAVPIPFGHTWNQACPNIKYDTDNQVYDFLLGYGPIEGLQESVLDGLGVKRDGVLVDTSEYKLYDGTQDSPYPGFAFVRFEEPQEDFAGKRHEITADVKGLTMGGSTAERNFANVLRHLLTNTTWGVGDKIDTTTFRQAESDLPTTDYFCDGAVTNKESARDIVRDLLFPMRARLERDYAGYWRVYVDKAKSSVASFGDNDGYWENAELKEVSATPLKETHKTITLKYGKEDLPTLLNEEQGLYKLEYKARSYGADKTYERRCRFFKEHSTAKKVLSYIGLRSIYSDRRAKIRCGTEARQRTVGEVITLYAPKRGINGKEYIVDSIRKDGLTQYEMSLREYSDSIYGDLSLSAPSEIVRSTDQRTGPAILEQYANTVIRYSADPPPHYPGLLWWETDVSPNKVYRSDGETWQFMGSPDALGLLNAPAQAGADVTGDHPDDVIFRQSSAPPHKKGRFWKDTDTGDFYRSNGSSWESIGAEDALRLINAPNEAGADQTINHPDSVIFYGTSAPSHRVGRLWCDTGTTPQKIHRSDGSNWNLVGTRDDDIRSNNDSSLIDGGKNEAGTIQSREDVPSNLRADVDQGHNEIQFKTNYTILTYTTGNNENRARMDFIFQEAWDCTNYDSYDIEIRLIINSSNEGTQSNSYCSVSKGTTFSAIFTGIPSNQTIELQYEIYTSGDPANYESPAHSIKGFTQVVMENI